MNHTKQTKQYVYYNGNFDIFFICGYKPNKNGNYCKANCRWSTAKQQARNKRKSA